jgi:hypothetical protein
MEQKLELRMYGLVPYNMSPIQQGIQFGHAVVDYGQTVKGLPPYQKIYNEWADDWKTFIILNGGTTNNKPNRLGTLNKHLQTLRDNSIVCQDFYEPDLGDQLTAVVFIVDERVFNKELYPDFTAQKYPYNYAPSVEEQVALVMGNQIDYKEWVESIGGEKNVFLREFLKQFRLA